MRLRWELHTVFKVLYTLKTLANFLTLFCQFYGIPQRNTYSEAVTKQSVRLDRRWADYVNDHDEFFVGQTHVHFKSAQIAFRDAFADGPKDRYCPPMIPYSRSDTKA
eukprot:2980648-Alexandrium_andersonii.AAC.1